MPASCHSGQGGRQWSPAPSAGKHLVVAIGSSCHWSKHGHHATDAPHTHICLRPRKQKPPPSPPTSPTSPTHHHTQSLRHFIMSQVRRSKRQRLDDGSTGTEDDVEEIIAEPATVENSVVSSTFHLSFLFLTDTHQARMFAGRGKAVAGTKRVMTKSTIAEAAVTYRYMTSDGASMVRRTLLLP